MGTYIIRDVQDFLIERWGQKQMRSDVDLQLAAHAKQVRLENAQLREQNRVLASLLAKAQPHVCSALCPSVKRDGDLWTHKDLCAHMEAALTATSQPAKEPVRHLCGARGFGQSIDDKCPGCDATSQEGQHEGY
jgi:hypothetical protein